METGPKAGGEPKAGRDPAALGVGWAVCPSAAPESVGSLGHFRGRAGAVGSVVLLPCPEAACARPGRAVQRAPRGAALTPSTPFRVHSHQRTFVLEVMGRHCG